MKSAKMLIIGLIAAVAVLVAYPVMNSQSWRGAVVYSVPTKEKVVALTFDDGPHPKFTPEILDILKKYHVRATFFMIGKDMEKNPDIVKRVIAEGSVVANHTYTHPHNIERDTESRMNFELEKCEKTIEKITGKRAYLFRPPRGLVNGKVMAAAGRNGYRTILWTVCADHHDAPTPKLMAKRVFDHVRPGAIILAHDGSFPSRWKDVDATPIIIEGLKKQGYRFVTVPELLKMRQH